jgi:S-adenosylmethionine/arginine decarboxylase-like enzyme
MHLRSGRKIGGTFFGNPKLLSSSKNIDNFLKNLVSSLEMTCLEYGIHDVSEAVKNLGQTPLTDEGGVTGVAVLSTSHAAIHTWPEESGATFDIHSCREFSDKTVEDLIKEYFQAEKVDIYDLSHSLKEKT